MSKTDKKAMSILLIIIMLFTIMNPLITNAANQAPDDAIEFKDNVVFESLLNNSNVDKNKDGYITKQEMEEITSIYIYNSNPGEIKSLEDLKYAVNIESLNVTGINEEIKEFDFSIFTKLNYLYISVNLLNSSTNYEIDKQSIKLPSNFFAYTYETGLNYNIIGFSVPEKIELEVNDLYTDNSVYNISHGKIENENIAKIFKYNGSQYYLQGVSEGTTKITYTSDIANVQTNVTVTKSNIQAEQELEDNTITSKLVYDRILMSNGTLWKVNSPSDVEIEDQNVSDYVYMRFLLDRDSMFLKLKENNTLNIESYLGEYGKTEEIKINQDVENVKQILSDYYSSELGYLTTDGEVYAIDINQQTNQVEIELIASGVTKAKGAYYVKDGSTYYMNGTLALNEEFEQAQSNTFTIGNKIYARRYFSNIIEIKLAAEDFKSYMPIYSDEYDTTYISTNGELKNFSGVIIPEGTKYQENNTVINKVPLTINSEDTLCWGDLEYLTEVEDVTSVIIPDNDPYKADDIFAIAVRKDGTIWTKDFYELTNFKKVISPKDCEEEVQLGNIDDDNVVTIKDVKLSLQYSLGKTDLSDVQIKAADVNEDGIVNIKDVKLILQYSLKLISEF